MNFSQHYFTEREDINKVNLISNWVDQIYNSILSKLKENMDYYFGETPDVKKIRKDVKSFLKYDTDVIPVEFFRFSKNNYNGEYISTNLEGTVKVKPHIVLYSADIADSLEDIQHKVIIYNRNGKNINYANSEKKDAIKLYNKIIKYIESSKWIKSTLLHELVHYYDDINYKDSDRLERETDKLNKLISKDYDRINDIIRQEYVNRNTEINAYLLQALKKVIDYSKNDATPLQSFDLFKKTVIYYFRNFDELADYNKRKVLKRIYDVYVKIKEVI